MQGQSQTIEQFLESIQSGSEGQHVQQVWEKAKNLPPEQLVSNARAVTYGVIARVMSGDEDAIEELKQSPELKAEVQAVLEACFTKFEQATLASSYSGSQRRTSSGG